MTGRSPPKHPCINLSGTGQNMAYEFHCCFTDMFHGGSKRRFLPINHSPEVAPHVNGKLLVSKFYRLLA